MTLPTRRSASRDRQREREAFKREVLSAVRDAFHSGGDTDDAILEKLDELAGPDKTTLTLDDIKGMDEQAINAAWPAISAVLEGSRPPAAVVPDTEPQSPAPPKATGAGIGGSVPETMSWDAIKNMTPEEHIAKRVAVDAFLADGGRAA